LQEQLQRNQQQQEVDRLRNQQQILR
jgi:hypothetical protein